MTKFDLNGLDVLAAKKGHIEMHATIDGLRTTMHPPIIIGYESGGEFAPLRQFNSVEEAIEWLQQKYIGPPNADL